MQPPKSNRHPLTIVGIVSNVIALTLVWVLLYCDSRSSFPSCTELVEFIKKMAETQVVTDEDLIDILGKPSESPVLGNFTAWRMAAESGTTGVDVEYVIVRRVEIVEGKKVLFFDENRQYRMCIYSTRTYRRGFIYLYGNFAQAFKGRSLFPLLPYVENERADLILIKP